MQKNLVKIPEQRKINSFYAVFKLFNRYFFKSFSGPFFSFAFPVLIYAILGAIMDYKIMLPGIVSMTSMSVGLTALPFSITELRKSVLLKRIGASPVKPMAFTITMVTYFIIIIFASVLWLLLWSIIITRDTKAFKPLSTIPGFFGFWYGNLLNIIVSVSLGFVIASVAKGEMQAQALGMLIMFPCNFLSGQYLSPDVIAKQEVMHWISRFIPFRYTTMLISESWYGDFNPSRELLTLLGEGKIWKQIGNPFLIHEYKSFRFPDLIKLKQDDLTKYIPSTFIDFMQSESKMTTLWDVSDHICGYVVPYITICSNLAISVKKFKWSSSR